MVPDIPTFAVDDGFSYLVPDEVTGVEVGSQVRVPLGGRTVRGYVTALAERRPERELRPLRSRSGASPIFDERLLRTLRWAAAHYVAPLSVVLGLAAPPNLPRRPVDPAPGTPGSTRTRPQVHVAGGDPAAAVADAVAAPIAGGRNALVVVATAAECEALAGRLAASLGDVIVPVTSSLGGAELTRAWTRLQSGRGLVAVGTRELATWRCGDLALALVVEEGRRAMKARQTPTIHVRDLLRRRSAVERFDLAFRSPVPTLEVLAAGAEVVSGDGRVWPLVEIADRNDEPPGGGVVGERARAAINAVAGGGGTVFVLVPRRGYAGAFACASCGSVRRCSRCGAAAGRSAECDRCGEPLGDGCECGHRRFRPLGAGVGRVVDELRRSVGDEVGEAGSGRAVVVGTERDLVGVTDRTLAVAVDLDGAILAPHYRAAEEALRLGARLALTVGGGRGRRCLIQTSLPDHPVVATLRGGRPLDFLRSELAARSEALLPPVGELIAVEVRGDDPADADAAVRTAAEGAAVRGPAVRDGEARWLLQGGDLHHVRVRLRGVVQHLRDEGWAVGVDADPIDL